MLLRSVQSTPHEATKTKYKQTEGVMDLNVCCFDTKAGKLFSAADNNYIYVLAFEGSALLENRFPQIRSKLEVRNIIQKKNKILLKLEDELNAYFAGTLQKFTVPMKFIGSEYQQSVWTKLQEVPYGTTLTYGDFAKMMGCPANHARAIGSACGNNAHLILIPCHRLVAAGSRGGGGYNGGGERKEWLIEHENKYSGL